MPDLTRLTPRTVIVALAGALALIAVLAIATNDRGDSGATGSPATFAVTLPPAPGRVVLGGTVDEASHVAIVRRAKAVFTPARVSDRMTVDARTNGSDAHAWLAAGPATITALGTTVAGRRLTSASLVVDDAGAVVTGRAPSVGVSRAVLSALRGALGAGVPLASHLRVVAAATTTRPAGPAGAKGAAAKRAAAAAAARALQLALDGAVARQPVSFQPGSTAFTAGGRTTLYRLAQILHRITGPHVRIAGYTDSLGGKAQNLALSRRRAVAVRRFLVLHSVAAGRLTAVGFGAAHPIASNATPAGQARNRRIEFHVQKG